MRSFKFCEVCGETANLTEIGCRRHVQQTRNGRFTFENHDVVCESCGFVFCGNPPDEALLYNYYRSSYFINAEDVIKRDFMADARIQIISDFLPVGASLLELGANSGDFLDELRVSGYAAVGLDPLDGCSNFVKKGHFEQLNELASSENCSFDAVVSYYTLEHVPRVREWLAEAFRFLRPRGILIIEVPDFDRYPVPALYFEHLSFFTTDHLTLLLEDMGFEALLVERENVSRNFGFLLVATPARSILSVTDSKHILRSPEVHERISLSRQKYHEGTEAITGEKKRSRSMAGRILSAIKDRDPEQTTVCFWPANNVSAEIAHELAAVADISISVVDSSAAKIGDTWPGFSSPVLSPESLRKDPKHRIFVLCSPAYNAQIMQQLDQLGLEDYRVLDGTEAPAF